MQLDLQSFFVGFIACMIFDVVFSFSNFLTQKSLLYYKQRKDINKEKNKDENDKLDD